jgi:hypothetical protein
MHYHLCIIGFYEKDLYKFASNFDTLYLFHILVLVLEVVKSNEIATKFCEMI